MRNVPVIGVLQNYYGMYIINRRLFKKYSPNACARFIHAPHPTILGHGQVTGEISGATKAVSQTNSGMVGLS